jgi:hypothetical protein
MNGPSIVPGCAGVEWEDLDDHVRPSGEFQEAGELRAHDFPAADQADAGLVQDGADLQRPLAGQDRLPGEPDLGPLTSELATNAVTHGAPAGGTFTLEVRSYGCCLAIEVHDASPQVPVLRPGTADTEHGRGLLLVSEIADSWGYYFESGRKHVWFHLHITSR